MKTLIIGLGMVCAMGVAFEVIFNQDAEVTKIEKEEIIVEVPEWQKDEDAIKAAQEVIHRKALEAELNALESNFASSTAIYEANKAEYLAEKERLEKELGTY